MRFLIAGLGSIGERHVQNLISLGYNDLFVYRTRGWPARTVGGVSLRTFGSLDQALDQRPDVVLVTNPTAAHIPVACEAARRGCHLFIEIPLSHSLEGTEELEGMITERGLVSLMGFNLRFHPCIRKIRDLVQEGAVGHVLAAQVESASYLPEWHPWEDYRDGYAARGAMGGGAILASGVHELDYLTWILGPAEAVCALAEHRSALELQDAEDTAALVLRFAHGAIGELHCDLVQRPSSRWCKIVGEHGTIVWDVRDNQVRLFHPGRRGWDVVLDRTGFDYNTTYVDELCHLIDCVRRKTPSINGIAEGRRNLQLALAAKTASRLGQPVALTWEDRACLR